tara:strand:+ start:222 stop:533 length:312 start_codon:yes stop_codon:yes gene_type:complete
MAKLKLYVIITLMTFSVLSAGGLWLTWGWYQDTKQELETVQLARKKAEENLALVSDQLESERATREAAESALQDLRDVPDVDYQTPLPTSVGNVLRDFRDRMQ